MQTTAAGGVSWEVVEEQTAAAPKEKKKKKQMTVKVPKWCGRWVVGMDDFKEGVVGAKSKNIAGTASIHDCQHCYVSRYIGMHKTGCSGETRLVLHVPSSS